MKEQAKTKWLKLLLLPVCAVLLFFLRRNSKEENREE